MNIIIAQVIGVIALIFTMVSVHQQNKQKMLAIQVFSNFAYLAQYMCLYAWAGAAMTTIAVLRCVVFYYYEEKNKKKSLAVLLIISLLIIASGILTYEGLISILPIFVALLYTYAMWQSNMKFFRIVSVISPICWLLYDISILAFVATVASVIELVSAVFAVLRFDIDKKE